MNQELLTEALEIIGTHLLYDPQFCPTLEGRRLAVLLQQLTGRSRNRALPPGTNPHLSRTVTLPDELDNAVTVAAEKAQVSRLEWITATLSRGL